jgi:hypothetical protein
MMIIERPSIMKDIQSGKWVLIYGRRKTGKTFIVSNFVDHDEFYFVKRDRTILSKKDWTELTYESFLGLLKRDLSSGRSIVVDEFHHLGVDFLDRVHSLDISGRLILISSIVHLSHSLISASSPILGKVVEVRVPLLSLSELLGTLNPSRKDEFEMIVYMMEPIVIGLGYKHPVDVIRGSKLTVPALVGEIFNEEDRKNTAIYEGVLRAISVGKATSSEVSSYIFSRKLIARDDPSLVQQYLKNLENIGLITRIPVWMKKRSVYKHVSPLIWSYLCLDERYSISDRDVSREEIQGMLDEIIPHILEDFLRNSLGRKLGLIPHVDHCPDKEVDGILVRLNRIEAVLEVKWKSSLRSGELIAIKEKLNRFGNVRKILMVPDKEKISLDGIEVMDPSDLS